MYVIIFLNRNRFWTNQNSFIYIKYTLIKCYNQEKNIQAGSLEVHWEE